MKNSYQQRKKKTGRHKRFYEILYFNIVRPDLLDHLTWPKEMGFRLNVHNSSRRCVKLSIWCNIK